MSNEPKKDPTRMTYYLKPNQKARITAPLCLECGHLIDSDVGHADGCAGDPDDVVSHTFFSSLGRGATNRDVLVADIARQNRGGVERVRLREDANGIAIERVV